MPAASSLYQSIIESLIDFKVVLVLAGQLNRQVAWCFFDESKSITNRGDLREPKFFKTSLRPAVQLPWTLIEHLENNFACREIRVLKQQTAYGRVLPSVLQHSEQSISRPDAKVQDNKV